MRFSSLWRLSIALALLFPLVAKAGGYDTPMLYSARHIGMGGTAIGYVSDPAALFHNPAGLAHAGRLTALADISLLLARVQASHQGGITDISSELTVAPVFLLGAGYRLNRWLTAGIAVYPVASAGATYRYPAPGNETDTVDNRTRLVFIEGSAALAINLPKRVRLGAGYRATYVSLERFQGARTAPVPGLDFSMTGYNWAGLRVGAQWTPVDWLQVGAVYRHRTETRVSNTEGIALGFRYTDIETSFVLPSKLGAGARVDRGPLGFAVDVEYLFNSQNKAYPLIGTPPNGMRSEIPNVFNWSNEITLRGGAEYRLLPSVDGVRRPLALRAGYVFDGKTTNERFPSAFGTPPGPTQVLTAGTGWNGGAWQANLAYAYRFGSGDVRPEDLNNPDMLCGFCGGAGNQPYRMKIHGLYADFSYHFD